MWVCVGVLSVGLGPGLDSMSPARSRRSASHAAGTHGRLPPKKLGGRASGEAGVGGYNLHSVPPNSPPDCGTVAHQPRAGCIRLVPTSRLYPFGAPRAGCIRLVLTSRLYPFGASTHGYHSLLKFVVKKHQSTYAPRVYYATNMCYVI